MADAQFLTGTQSSVIETNKVLRNTYMLLSMTLAFSAFTAGISIALNLPYFGLLINLVGYIGLLFLTSKFRNSSIGILCVFALTGFMGLTIGPMVNAILQFSNGGTLVTYALGTTAVTFLGLSGYAITTKKDFSFLGPMLFVGLIVAVCAVIAGFFIDMTAFHLATSSIIVLLMAGMMLYETGQIVNGGETNYIMATVSLFVSIYNMFMNLLMIFGIMGGED